MENKNFNETKERIIKSCKALRLFMRILLGIVVITVIVTVIVTVLSRTSTKENIENTNNEIISDVMTEENNAEKEIDVKMLIAAFFTLASILCIDKLLKETIEKETPFTETNVKTLRALDYAIFATSICLHSLGGYIGSLSLGIISKIFEYGYLLQTESDETL